MILLEGSGAGAPAHSQPISHGSLHGHCRHLPGEEDTRGAVLAESVGRRGVRRSLENLINTSKIQGVLE